MALRIKFPIPLWRSMLIEYGIEITMNILFVMQGHMPIYRYILETILKNGSRRRLIKG